MIGRDVLLFYPNFREKFIINTDASNMHLRGIMIQNGNPIPLFTQIISAQINYTTTEKVLLSIVENLKKFRNILLGHRITVYKDHKNITFENFIT